MIAAEEPPETTLVGKLLDIWLKYRRRNFGRPVMGTWPHDPLTVAEALTPEWFVKYTQGHSPRVGVSGPEPSHDQKVVGQDGCSAYSRRSMSAASKMASTCSSVTRSSMFTQQMPVR